MTPSITKQDVLDVLSSEEEKRFGDITRELSETCPSCGRPFNEKPVERQVRDALSKLLDEGEIRTTPGFKYRKS